MKKNVVVACLLFSLASASAIGAVTERAPVLAPAPDIATFVLDGQPQVRLLAGTTQLGGSWYCRKLQWNCDAGDANACTAYAKNCLAD